MPTFSESWRARAADMAVRARDALPPKEQFDLHTALIIRDSGTLVEQSNQTFVQHPDVRKVYQKLRRSSLLQHRQTREELLSLAGFAQNYVMTKEYLKHQPVKPGVLTGQGTGQFVAYAISETLSLENAALLTVTVDTEVEKIRQKFSGERVVARLLTDEGNILKPDDLSNFEDIVEHVREEYMELASGAVIAYRLPHEVEFEGRLPSLFEIKERAEQMGNISVQAYKNLSRNSSYMDSIGAVLEEVSVRMPFRKPRYRILDQRGWPVRNAVEARSGLHNWNAPKFNVKNEDYQNMSYRMGIRKFEELPYVLPEYSDGSRRVELAKKYTPSFFRK